MAVLIRREPALAAMLQSVPTLCILEEDRLSAFPSFARRFAAFLEDHGHREVDFDPYHPTWIEAPHLVLDALRLLLDQAPGESPSERLLAQKVRAQKAEFALAAALPEDLRFLAQELIGLVRTYTALDDLEHYETARLTLLIRRGLRALGEQLQECGIVAEPMDVFFARAAELTQAIADDDASRWASLAAEIRQAKRAYLASRERAPAWVWGAPEAPTAGAALSGIPGSPGIAEGTVFVVRSADDFGRFPRGAVLVARHQSRLDRAFSARQRRRHRERRPALSRRRHGARDGHSGGDGGARRDGPAARRRPHPRRRGRGQRRAALRRRERLSSVLRTLRRPLTRRLRR